MKTLFAIVTLLLLPLAPGCGDADDSSGTGSPDGKPVVYTTNYPLAYFAGRIAGDTAEVRFPDIEGDPAFWQPGDSDIADMQNADLILLNGATYEKWLATASLPSAKTVDTAAGFADRFIVINHDTTHSHGKDGEHSHAGTAFTTWMDFDLAQQQAKAVLDALIKKMPEKDKALKDNADKLFADLAVLNKDMQAVAGRIGERPLVASHPVYQYFARRYALNIASVLWEPETVPTAADMEGLEKLLKDHPAKWMLWEGEPAGESVELLNTIGVRSVVVDPAGNRPDAADWLAVMRQNVENLKVVADVQQP